MNVYIRELSRRLGARGVSVDVFTRRQDPDTPRIVEFGENARVIHLEAGPVGPTDKYRVLDYLPDFVQGVSEFRRREGRLYHLVHGHYWLSGPVSIHLAERWGIPLVAMFHTLGRLKNQVSTNGREREKSARLQVERETMLAAARIVAASPTDMEQMVRHYGVSPSRIRIVPGGVDSSLFHPLPRGVARGILGVGSEKQILFVGRIQWLKGIDLLLRAFAVLLAGWTDGPKPRLTVVGGRNPEDDSDPEALETKRLGKLASELGVLDHVTFQGAVPQERLPFYYSAADVVVVPSLYESFGLVALEAMACGTPVVASRVGGLQWTVRDGQAGFLVRRRSPEQFAAAMGLILRDEELRAQMSEGAAAAARGFSWDSAAERTLALYHELLSVPEARLCGACP